MFGNMLEDMQKKQEALKENLANIVIKETTQGITIIANAARQIQDIQIDHELLEDKEALEDLLVVVFNQLSDKISAEEAKASGSMLKDILPPNMSGLFNL